MGMKKMSASKVFEKTRKEAGETRELMKKNPQSVRGYSPNGLPSPKKSTDKRRG